jgi:8-oxo-dGTP pyrophosphatase MutT (NUDIX family)
MHTAEKPSDRTYFISYRRAADGESATAFAGALAAEVGAGAVFFDRNPASLPPGSNWPLELVSRVLSSNVLLVLIGPGWLDELKRRNQLPDGTWMRDLDSTDWVRREVMFALHFGKQVVPVLCGEVTVPKEASLPPDLHELSSRQVFRVPASPDWASAVKRLTDWVGHLAGSVAPAIYPELGRPAIPPVAGDDIRSSFGRRWQPETERDSPHRWDYKFCVLDPEVRHRLRIALLAARETGELQRGFTLAELRTKGECRKFAQSSIKSGMFIQASCLVTDGQADAKVQHVLLCIRDSFQITDPFKIEPRNVDGESCLFATCLSSFEVHAETGHLSAAVLNSLRKLNPWAVFSRKLLFPDSLVDCRFLGIGFNFKKPDKEYIHLVWHVRTRSCPRMMLVPAREEHHFDEPTWQTLGQLEQYDFEKAPIDRLVIERLFNLRLPVPEKDPPSVFCGFVTFPGFDQTQVNGFRPVVWHRDTVPIDLLRMFQQMVHRGKWILTDTSPLSLVAAFSNFVRCLSGENRLPVLLSAPIEGNDPLTPRLRLTLTDEAGRTVAHYLVFVVVSDQPELTGAVVGQVREWAETGFDADSTPAAVLVLHGVHSPSRFELQGASSLHDQGNTPIHVVRVALSSAGRPVKRIAHAIIPVRQGEGREADRFVVTLHPEDELPRLPGGKIEGEESPAQAVVRELGEELGLKSHQFVVVRCLKEDGVVVTEPSPSTGLLTDYRIFSFLVRLEPGGEDRMRRLLREPPADSPCRVWVETFDRWRETGLGFDRTYPKAILALLTPEERAAAALSIPEASAGMNDLGKLG